MRPLRRSPLVVALALGLSIPACVGDDPVVTRPADAGLADAPSAPPGAPADAGAPAADAGQDACAPEPPERRAAVADTFLVDEGGNCNPATRFGGADVVNVGLNDTSVVP